MRRRLFLTGPMGCGKSTAIRRALGEKLPQMGGFLTCRIRNESGRPIRFEITSPDGSRRETFLDLAHGLPQIDLKAFSGLGTELLCGEVLVLDEIGGVELLNPAFAATLEQVLRSDVPVLGVIKGEGPAGALIEKLGLTEEYESAARRLRQQLREDENTLVHVCGQFDGTALQLAENWVKEYVREELI